MDTTKTAIIKAFGAADRAYDGIRELHIRAQTVAPSRSEALQMTRDITMAMTMEPQIQQQYLKHLAAKGSKIQSFSDLLDSSMEIIHAPDKGAVAAARSLLITPTQALAGLTADHHLPPDRHMTESIHQDFADLHDKAARTMAGAMMFQTLLKDSQKSAYVDTVAKDAALENNAVRLVGERTIATLRMKNYQRRRLTGHDIIRMRQESDLRLEQRYVRSTMPTSHTTLPGCARLTADRVLNRRCADLIDNWRVTDRWMHADMIRLWAEIRDNLPRH